MGREQRRTKTAKGPRRIKLPEAAFWKFRASVNELSALELDATRAAQRVRQQIAEAEARTRALFEALGKAHGFDPKRHYRWDDTTCELIEVTMK